MTDTLRRAFDNAADARNFMLSGCATFTAVSKTTGTRFTFRVSQPKNERGSATAPHFVALMNGPDNESNYQYLGVVRNRTDYAHGHKSRVSPDAPSARAFAWVFDQLVARDTIPPALEVWHEGRCGRCNRKLTVPSSIARGLGPECAGRGA